jgi:hypothetical protein
MAFSRTRFDVGRQRYKECPFLGRPTKRSAFETTPIARPYSIMLRSRIDVQTSINICRFEATSDQLGDTSTSTLPPNLT